MAAEAPKIDPRSYDELVRQIEDLAERYTAHRWRPAKDEPVDAGGTLIRLFAGMAAQAIERLNRTPEKNFLAFLDLIGVQQQPPQAARVPLTFSLAQGAAEAVVPLGTQAAAAPAEDVADQVIFETERDLVLTPAQLVAVVAHDPATDQFADRTALATGERDEPFAAFEGSEPIEHSLYLAWDGILTLPAPKTASLTLATSDPAWLHDVSWEYWDGVAWKPLGAVMSSTEAADLRVTIDELPAPPARTIDGVAAGWLRARLTTPLIENTARVISGLTATFTVPAATGPVPQHAFFNTTPLDLSKEFYPFGERPALNDALYLAVDQAFVRPGTVVTVDVQLAKLGATQHIAIVWEAWIAGGWQPVTTDSDADGTQGFTTHGAISLWLPDGMTSGTVNGLAGFWLRARIAEGNYGEDLRYDPSIDENGNVRRATEKTKDGKEEQFVLYRQTSPGYSPPQVRVLRLGYHTAEVPPSACKTLNNLTYADHTADLAADQPFTPFVTLGETQPALYLGFDRAFASRRVTLYVQVAPSLGDGNAGSGTTARIVWEYLGPGGWRYLGAEDETAGFTERGLMTFVGPRDLAAYDRFGRRLCWLRARAPRAEGQAMPRLRRLLLNTTWAGQALSVSGEILGSSDGTADQRFSTISAPVLDGAQVDLLEQTEPPLSELTNMGGASSGARAMGADGRASGGWVRWREMPDFHGSGPRDRHYVLDYIGGELRFGDGQHAMVPPIARNSIRMSYRTGGGTRGNRPAGTITQLKTAIPTVAGVTNYEPAAGGADAETTDEIGERGPRMLRHRGRAVAAQDIEDLAREASPEVARARAVGPDFDPLSLGNQEPDPTHIKRFGTVELILVPRSTDDRPTLSQELARRVAAYLTARCASTFDLRIREPAWTAVRVTATVAPASLVAAETLAEEVRAALRRFLHPLSGGPDRQGWAFGRRVYESDLYGLIESLPGVLFVPELQLSLEPDGRSGEEAPDPALVLIYSGEHTINVVWPEGGD